MVLQASLGASAMERKDFLSAISHYTSAISESPTSPDYHIKRSTAYQRCTPPQYDLALVDAEAAVYYAHKRGKKELIASAQMRRGITLFGLKRWADARKCFEWVKQRNPRERGLGIWEKKVDDELEKTEQGSEGTEAVVVEVPELQNPTADPRKATTEKASGAGDKQAVDPPKGGVVTEVEGVQTPADKIRHEWYQTSETVVVTLLAKGVPGDNAMIDIQEQSVSISFPLSNGSTYYFSLDPLFASVDTSNSTSSIKATKVELVLKKSRAGQKWSSLEDPNPAPASSKDESNTSTATAEASPSDAIKHTILTTATAKPPTYPTSSRSGPKNWDKLATDLIKSSKQKPTTTITTDDGKGTAPAPTKEAEEDNDDGFDEEDESDPVNGFFKKLYAGADPDTRRAMMKSYQESNGTALSTNWAEVGKGKVETSPPEGMEAKKWGG